MAHGVEVVMIENRKRSDGASADAGEGCAGSSSCVARWILDALLGEKVELTIGSRRFLLTQERAYRLEALDNGFVFFMGSSAALERRLTALAGGRWRSIRASASTLRRKNIFN
jgi:hypothetical protein